MIEFFAFLLIGGLVVFVAATGALALLAAASIPLILMTSVAKIDQDN